MVRTPQKCEASRDGRFFYACGVPPSLLVFWRRNTRRNTDPLRYTSYLSVRPDSWEHFKILAERTERLQKVIAGMQGEIAERWRELCALAAAEQDPDRLLALIREINMLLEKKEMRRKSGVRINGR
jgi:hypothetical protein